MYSAKQGTGDKNTLVEQDVFISTGGMRDKFGMVNQACSLPVSLFRPFSYPFSLAPAESEQTRGKIEPGAGLLNRTEFI